MKFVKYPSITNTFKGDEIDFIRINHRDEITNTTWDVYEKIHGANFSLWYDGSILKTAKRSGFCGDENFYSSDVVVDRYRKAVDKLYEYLKKPFVVYGELFGGKYEGIVSGQRVKVIQKEVQYCPYNDFAAFDIATINEDSTLTFLDELAFQDIIFSAGFYTAPYINTFGTLDAALGVSEEFLTYLPTNYNLPQIENNWAEGIIIKPSKPIFMSSGSRVIFKKKHPLFKEDKSVEIESCTTDELLKFFEELKSKITVNRFNNVFSHWGEGQPAKIYYAEFMQDCLDECDKIVYNTFSQSQKKLLANLSARYVWPIIREIAFQKAA